MPMEGGVQKNSKVENFIPSCDDLNYLVALNGSESFKRNFRMLFSHFKSLERIYNATEDMLNGVPGLAKQSVAALLRIRSKYKPGMGMERLQGKNVRLVTFWDEDYPDKMREIELPPPLLYVKGEIKYDFDLSVAIVGTRQTGNYGLDQSHRFGKKLAHLGFTIISGGAAGIDSKAHVGALESDGRTFAVFGCGIDISFPQNHEKLFDRITKNGALISEFPPGSPPEPYRFPLRNRIIAGMSRGVLVVQAPKKSGALITSEYANEMGREVMAIPGPVNNPKSEGSNQLICDGATMVQSPDDILNIYKLMLCDRKEDIKLPNLDKGNRKIIEAIGWEPKHIDEIAHELNVPVNILSGLMLRLHLDGYIKELSGKRYVRIAP
ncbi:MAG: DNA-processing protein DprA [bacterium]